MKEIFILSPFETPDLCFLKKTVHKKAFSVLHLGRDEKTAYSILDVLPNEITGNFGVYIALESICKAKLPSNITKIFVPYSFIPLLNKDNKAEVYCLITSAEEAQSAVEKGIRNLVLKGNEAAGQVSSKSAFILFQEIIHCKFDESIHIYIQGGIGIHTASAVMALGASGVILDDQLALFPECSAPKELKDTCRLLSGTETKVIDGFRILQRNNSPQLPANATYENIVPFLGKLSIADSYIPMGQAISLAAEWADRYKTIDNLVKKLHESLYSHLHQAKSMDVIFPESPMAKSMKTRLPVMQGPMSRISDVPDFIEVISDSGALPFLALSLLKGESAKSLLADTKNQLGEKPWGVGLLGFAPKELRDEQTKYVLENKPSAVIISGGNPAQAKTFEKEGIQAFLHVPSPALLDMFIKEGVRKFIIEGRECGGHIGPLSSFVLWEKQINRLLQEEDLSAFHIFFAGGVHDAFSTAFVSIMAVRLAAKGAKTGVVMGSAYLYTNEAVETGAILEEYQKQLIEKNETAILETAPGHETCSLKSPYTIFFNKEKERLNSELTDKKEVWEKLESLNIGRLRIASKGVERVGDEIKELTTASQIEQGMYMIGQIASLRQEKVTLNDLHTSVTVDSCRLIKELPDIDKPRPEQTNTDIAIVGMACIFPQAKNLDEYWKNILLGKDCVTEVPDHRWNKNLYYDPAGGADKTVSKWGGFIPVIDFDPLEFGIPPQSLASIESAQLLALLTAKKALEDAGYDMAHYDGENTSVIIGAEGGNNLANSYSFRGYVQQVLGDMPEAVKANFPTLTEDSFAGVLVNVISGRISNRLNLGGRNYTVDAACGSSLAALDVACQELYSQRSDTVLVGGVDVHNDINDYLMFSATRALSPKGRCATFDTEADGIALGEGVAILVLKRVEDAIRDNNKIYSVIKGVGGSSDGKSLGLTAPSRKGQIKALERAYAGPGILPSEVGLIEAHGTGTVAGDKTELNALTDMFLDSGAVTGQTVLGSVKTQIGHTKCTAGMAGLIKASLSVYYGVKPPTIHLKSPNQCYKENNSPFVFNHQSGIWSDSKRIAGISAFGFGGTNFHTVIENYKSEVEEASIAGAWPSEIFVFRGDTREEAKALLKTVARLLQLNDTIRLQDIAYSLATGNNNKRIQYSIIAQSHDELLQKMEAASRDDKEDGIYYSNPVEGKVAFLFSGQGSQRINMARDLLVAFPSMRKMLAENREYEKVIFPDVSFDSKKCKQQEEELKDTRNAQPLLGMIDWNIADFFRTLGVEPDMVAGHSYGELPALCFAGAFPPSSLVYLSRKRAESILAAVGDDKGMMAAVSAGEPELSVLLKDEKEIWAVNYNSHKQIVIAGTTPAMVSFIAKLKEQNIPCKELNVACAFHTPLIGESGVLYEKALSGVEFSSPRIPVWSNTTSEPYPNTPEKIKERLCKHLTEPVLFTKQIENMYADGARVFVETGPGRVLIGLSESILKNNIVTIQTESKGAEGVSFLLSSLAKYISTGRNVNLQKLFEGRKCEIIDLSSVDKYKKKNTIWQLDGQYARPAFGEMPSCGALPITQPIQIREITSMNNNQNEPAANQVMLEYLQSMRMMIQAQHDIMLNYLGNTTMRQPLDRVEIPAGVRTQPILPIENNRTEATPKTEAVPDFKENIREVNLKEVILNIVSEKTGYPKEMLGGDMDMEADLSIDSIKRMEIIGVLKEQLNLSIQEGSSENILEKMSSLKTLDSLEKWLKEHFSHIVSQGQKAQSKPEVSQEVTTNDIKNILLEIVSNKTGYPTEMLKMDLDLEADLSIDSIKRMEIVGALRDKLSFDNSENSSENIVEKMTALKTLQALVSWIEQMTKTTASEAGVKVNASKPAETEKEVSDNSKISRMIPILEECDTHIFHEDSLRGLKFALTENKKEITERVKVLLSEKGAEAHVVPPSNSQLGEYDGLIVINTYGPEGAHYTIKEVVEMIKRTDLERIKYVYIFSDLIANIDKDRVQGKNLIKYIQGFSGLAKSLNKEFSKNICRCVVLSAPVTEKELPEIILKELLIDDKSSEVVYSNNGRSTFKWVHDTVDKSQAPRLKVTSEKVVLVLGGAQGITAELVASLSTEYPYTYILVGRTEKPSPEKIAPYRNLHTKAEIRACLLKEENLKTPAEIEKKVTELFKMNQVLKAVDKIAASGAKVIYESIDLKDEQKVRQFIKEVYDQYGRVDGVIHGAGLLDDKLFTDKTLESFDRVYSTKITPLRVLIDEIRPDIKWVVLFSSIASVYGNRGQTDYASANSVMDSLASLWKEQLDARVLTINWGPWKGAGMVSDSLAKEYERRNIAMIPLKHGIEYFIDELKYGQSDQVLIMAGENW